MTSEPTSELDDPQVAPRERGLFGASRMDAVRGERNDAAASLRNRLAIMRKADGKAAPAAIPEGGGSPLGSGVRARMEPRLGADLSGVRVHAGGESAEAAKSLGARAFTVGNDVHFGAGELQPGTKEGDKLLAHELTHVVQGQRSGIQRKPEEGKEGGGGAAGGGHDAGHEGGGHDSDAAVSHPDEPAEKEADAKSDEVAGALHGDGKDKGGAEEEHAEGGHGHGDGKGKDAKDDKKDKAGGKAAGKHAGGGAHAAGGGGAHAAGGGGANAAGGGGANAAGGGGANAAGGGGANAAGGGGAAGAAGGETAAGGGAAGGQAAGGQAAGGGTGGGQAAGGAAGGQAAAGAAPSQKPAAVAAKYYGSGHRIFRAPTPNSSANNAGGANNSRGGAPPANNAPPDPWQTYCNSLPPDLKAKALTLSPAEQQPFKDVGRAYQATFLALQTSAARVEMVTLPEDAKGKLAVVIQNVADRDVYETKLAGAPRAVYRDLTPDERKDLNAVPAQMPGLLADPVKLDDWRKLRTGAALAANPQVAAGLAAAGQNAQQIVQALSTGPAGERLRRVIADPGFENEADKAGFILDVKGKLATNPDPMSAMKAARPAWVLKGKLATGDASFHRMPIMKAFPLANVWKYGTVPIDVAVAALEAAPRTDPDVPRKPDGKVDKAQLQVKMTDGRWKASTAKHFAAYIKTMGSLAGCDFTLSGGPGVPAAYWMFDQQGVGLLAPEKSGLDVSKILAVDENPDYQLGFAIVSLPDAMKNQVASDKVIRRPTAIDGLNFDQFAIADPSACYGVTSGGMNEVVVGSVKVTQTKIERIC